MSEQKERMLRGELYVVTKDLPAGVVAVGTRRA